MEMEERRCANVAGSYYECGVILFLCQRANSFGNPHRRSQDLSVKE